MEAENEIFLVGIDVAAFDARTKVIHPPETATLAGIGGVWRVSEEYAISFPFRC